MQKLVKTQKLTNNAMSSFGLIEENMELSLIYLAVTLLEYINQGRQGKFLAGKAATVAATSPLQCRQFLIPKI